ncbi:carbonic anhydrase [Sanguibacter hominis ATCC BAA-789]|uniref:carbonic anhydrase n=1 Tax=Sanguibacter hominis ATCC BAA-789 TaxID=1312740 RepID=A0A9X5FDX2_9MICO|nr:carbonic anhydrase [Sanguibacter hominis]NKX92041.1 carbonic anhydrase [Sanguibacter hominis ATCC BAA-789]
MSNRTDGTAASSSVTGPISTPAEAWAALRDGNQRFVRDEMAHPSQGAGRRQELAVAQNPFAVIFGCSDSRVAAEIIFDQGLGDTFVVRTAGHVLDTTVIGSIEYGIGVLDARLVVVLAHDSCGAVAAAAHTLATGEQATGFVRAVVDRVIPSIVNVTSRGEDVRDENMLRREHVRHTVDQLYGYSAAIRAAVDDGYVAIVGVEYTLADGRATLLEVKGDVGEKPVTA